MIIDNMSPTTGKEAALKQLFHAQGLKLTPQRVAVVSYLAEQRGHRTAAEVLQYIEGAHPVMNASTIYRTLAVLTAAGLVSATHLGGGDIVYEWIGDGPHHHLICRHCGNVQQLSPTALNDVAQLLERNHHFQVELAHLALFGACEACVTAATSGE